MNWRHFSWKKLIFEEVALILMNLGLKSPSEIKKFHLLSATSSKINFFQEKCLQFISYNNLKRFRGLQTVFEDMTLVLPCPSNRGSRPKKKMFLFILMYVIAPSFSPKLGHIFLNYQNFLFYEHCREGNTTKYWKNCTFWKIANFYM